MVITLSRRWVADPVNRLLRYLPTWPLYIFALLLPSFIFWKGLTGRLGVDPVKEMEHEMGRWALWFLIGGLAVTPLRRIFGINAIRFRRAIGLVAVFFVFLHLLVWLVLDVQIPEQIWGDILKRPYITIGMAAFVLLLPLAVTSNNRSIRKLGRNWRRLHRLVYVAVPLGALHYILLAKGFQIEPLVYMAVVICLLFLRLPLAWQGRGRPGTH